MHAFVAHSHKAELKGVFVIAVHKDRDRDACKNDVWPDSFTKIEQREREPKQEEEGCEADLDAEHKKGAKEKFDTKCAQDDECVIERKVIGEVVADDGVYRELCVQ